MSIRSFQSTLISSKILLPVSLLLVSMISIQGGAALAKTLFPSVGATGITALRLSLGALILVIIFKPWRIRFSKKKRKALVFYGLALGTMNYLFYLSIRTIPLGVAVALEFTGPLALALFGSRRVIDFIWVLLEVLGLWKLLPLNNDLNHVDLLGSALALGAGACWATYILTGQRAGADHGPATVAIGTVIAAVIFVPICITFSTDVIWEISFLPTAMAVAILSTVLPYSLEMIALTRLPIRIFGTLMSLEPAMAAFSGVIFLDESLNLSQWLGLLAIASASAGSALSIRKCSISVTPSCELES